MMQPKVITLRPMELMRIREPARLPATTAPVSTTMTTETVRKRVIWIMTPTLSVINQIINNLVRPKAVLMYVFEFFEYFLGDNEFFCVSFLKEEDVAAAKQRARKEAAKKRAALQNKKSKKP